MYFDSSSKFIASLAKFLQSLCNGYVDFDKGVEVIGHIYLNVDSDTGKKIDYVLNEKVCKNDNSVTFISHSFHAQPAEKPKPPSKKEDEKEHDDADTVVMDNNAPSVPASTNVGTIGSMRKSQDSYSPGAKRPYSGRMGMSPAAKMGRNSGAYGDIGYDNANSGAYGGDDDSYGDNSHDIDQKPIIDDISIIKEESNAMPHRFPGNGITSGKSFLFFIGYQGFLGATCLTVFFSEFDLIC